MASQVLIEYNSGTLNSNELVFSAIKRAIPKEIDTKSYFRGGIPFTSEPKLATKWMEILNRTYCTQLDYNIIKIEFENYHFNRRIFLSEGTYFNYLLYNSFNNLFNPNINDSENNDSDLNVYLTNIERLISIHSFITNLKKKDNTNDEISGMKEIFLQIDELVDNKDYPSIDHLINSFINYDFSFQFHISLLASTLKIKQNLKNRINLYDNALEEGVKLLSDADLQSTLQGLK